MSVASSLEHVSESSSVLQGGNRTRTWLLHRICSRNPFYLLSVCFVLHGTAHWFHADSGTSFSPWPLLGLTAGYTLLLASTGFVIIRFGKVWDDARSILLIILLLFVQLSLIFDETLVREPFAGRLLLLSGWAFSIVLTESLLLGLRISLPWLFRVPYHSLIALLFLYPLSLVSLEHRLAVETVVWRIALFPPVGAIVFLTLIPAIRRGNRYTRQNGTPWLWPWYPWSLFVFLGVCICFRAYSLCLSFDPVLGESLQSSLAFSSVFGVYFLVPLFMAAGVLLLEIGLVENRRVAIRLAMLVPVICLYLAFPAEVAYGPYNSFVRMLLAQVGSPVWITLLGAIVFYGIAAVRRVESAEKWLGVALLLLTTVDSQTISLSASVMPQWWPLIVLSLIELCLGLVRRDSHAVFTAMCAGIAGLHVATSQFDSFPTATGIVVTPALLIMSLLLVGSLFRDEFAWFLRTMGAPLLVVTAIAGCVSMQETAIRLPNWYGPAIVVSASLVALAYASILQMPLYRLASLVCALIGSLGITEMTVTYLIRESGWRGATSFVIGIGWLMLAVAISSWKAGWFRNVPQWLRAMLVV